jgi:endonuclease I
MEINMLNKIIVMKKITFFLLLISCAMQGQIPAGYYNTCIGNSGNNLKNKLHTITANNHSAVGYTPGVWDAFETTDVKPNGKVWDIYGYNFFGAQPYEYSFNNNDECGAYSAEGDCYNREHTWPQSYFNSAYPMYSDLHHVMASDGTVNGIHGNDPYGKVTGTIIKTSLMGAKSGKSNNYAGYTNNVFEPIDSFKGDIARAYFYMATRYQGEDAGWANWEMASGANLTADAIKVLLAWHRLDPVSKKEIDRNNAIFALQGNRNPFVDSAVFVECIWGGLFCGNVAIKDNVKNNASIAQSMEEIIISTPNDTSPIQYQIISATGQVVIANKTNFRKINIDYLAQGVYCLKVQTQYTTSTFRFLH